MKIHRRDVLKSGLAGLAGLTFGPSALARAHGPRMLATPNGRRLILLPMRGGFDGLHFFPPIDSSYSGFHARRPTLAITSSPLALNDGTGHAFNEKFTRMKALWDAGDLAMLHQVGWPGPNGSHFVSQDRNASARENTPQHDSGWLIRAAEEFNMTTTQAIATGVGSVLDVRQSPGSPYRPLSLGNVDGFKLPSNDNDVNDPLSVDRNDAGIAAEGEVIPTPGSVVEKFHIANQSAFSLIDAVDAGVDNYDNLPSFGTYTPSFFGQNMKGLARLISVVNGMPPEYDIPLFGLTFGGGFDTHGDQASRLATLIEDIDINLQGFVDDLVTMNEWDNTLILFYTEFGRRVFENGNNGTDHGEGNNVLALGGCVNGGNHFGNISTPTELVNNDNVPVSMDFRHIFETLLGSWLGATPAQVLSIIDEPSDMTLRPDLSTLLSC